MTVLEGNVIGVLVKYIGKNREGLYDHLGTVERVNETGSVGVRYPDGIAEIYKGNDGLVWASRWAWSKVKSEMTTVAETTDLDEVFTTAAGGTTEVLRNEIQRLESRLADLRKALEVVESL